MKKGHAVCDVAVLLAVSCRIEIDSMRDIILQHLKRCTDLSALAKDFTGLSFSKGCIGLNCVLRGDLEAAYRALPLRGEPFITRFLASEVATSHYYDISRAKRDFGYRPQIGMQEATRRVADDLRRRLQ